MRATAVIRTASDMTVVRQLFEQYQAQLGVDLCFQGFTAELDGLPGKYAEPRGRLLLAELDGAVAGCVALRPYDGTRGEMKRLYVKPEVRGHGIGRALVARVIDEARAIGYSELVLDTLPTMTEAQALYEWFGFREDTVPRDHPVAGTRYLTKHLADD